VEKGEAISTCIPVQHISAFSAFGRFGFAIFESGETRVSGEESAEESSRSE
jgi:hypothetical protein